jgi:S1-C subfamily serine protease
LDRSWRGGDAGLVDLRAVPRLVKLSIDDAPLTDLALDHLAALADLAELDIRRTAFTSAGLYRFRERKPATRVYAIGPAMLGVHAPHRGKCQLTGIHPGSGAFQAGLLPADEIIAVEGRPIGDFGDLTIAVYTRRPGEKLKVDFRRGGEHRTTEVQLQERKEQQPER